MLKKRPSTSCMLAKDRKPCKELPGDDSCKETLDAEVCRVASFKIGRSKPECKLPVPNYDL